MSIPVHFQDGNPYDKQANMPLQRNQDRFFQGREWSSEVRENGRNQAWDIPNNSLGASDRDLSQLFQRTRLRETRAPTNSPASPNPLSRDGIHSSSRHAQGSASFRPQREMVEKRDIPSRRGIDNRIPMRNPGESVEDYFARAGGMEKTSYPKGYSMPSGRLSDDINAIYQPNGRWVSGQNGLVFEAGEIVDGEFVKDDSSFVKKTASDRYSMPLGQLADGVNAIYQRDGRWVSGDKGFVFERGQVINGEFVYSEPLDRKFEETPKKVDKTSGWTCGGITVATLSTVAVVALAILASGHELNLKPFGLS